MTCCERSQQWITALQLLRRAEKQNLGMMSFDLTCLADYRAGRYVYIYICLEPFDDPCFGWSFGLVLGG